MKVKDHRHNRILEYRNGASLIDDLVPRESDAYAMREAICGIFGRMLDHMNITDQQKIDIVAPYENWEALK